jgi:hypothetical protein
MISFLTVGIWRSLQITVFGTYQDASTIMCKAFDWNRFRISMLQVEAEYCFIYENFVVCGEF